MSTMIAKKKTKTRLNIKTNYTIRKKKRFLYSEDFIHSKMSKTSLIIWLIVNKIKYYYREKAIIWKLWNWIKYYEMYYLLDTKINLKNIGRTI